MAENTLDESLANGVHADLNRYCGNWEGTAKVWFGKDNVADESPVKGSIRPLLGGRFILHEYEGTFQGKPLQGFGIFGYHLKSGKFQSAWVDSFHMGTEILFSEGDPGAEKHSVLAHYKTWGYEPLQTWGWRTELEMTDDDHILVTAYNIEPGAEEQIATQSVYHRVK
jgi:hypothetical protein